MSKDELPPLIQDLLYAERYRLLDNTVGQATKRVIAAGVDDDFIRSLVQGPVRRHKIAQAFAGPFDLPHLGQGQVVLGLDLRGRRVCVPIQYFNGHSLTLGGSGAGKTVKSRWLALQIAPYVQGMWLFDLRKREFAILQPYLACLGIDLIILPARMLRLNPLQLPACVEPADWAPRVADLLVQVLSLPPRATKLLHATILSLYDSNGIFLGSQNFPTLFDLREAIAKDERANPQARMAIVDTLDPILLSLRSVLSYRVGWSTDELARRHIVFELGGIAEVDKDLILSSLLLAEFTSRIAQGLSNAPMQLWVCCDEAARLIAASNPAGGLVDLLGLVRGAGIGCDLSVQSSQVTPAVLSNTAVKVIGRSGSATDYDVMGAAMGLTVEQRRYLAHTLVPGLFLGQVGEGDWRHPFIFRIPPIDFARPPADSAAPVRAAELKALPEEPRRPKV